MGTVQWRPEINALTTPNSYWMRFVPKGSVNTEELAVRMAAEMPNYSEEEIRTFLATRNRIIKKCLSNGEQVTEEDNFTYSLSFTGRLDNPDDPPPPVGECLQVQAHVTPPFEKDVRQAVQMLRLSRAVKLPLVNTVKDTLLRLDNVLNPDSVLRITGEDLYFDPVQGTGQCVIAGTESGEAVQSKVNLVTDSSIMLMPDIPAQSNAWNNEYRLSVTTHYSEHGTPRTGTYAGRLRTPLAVPGLSLPTPPETGILTDNSATPYVVVTNGTASADERLRIQVIQDLIDEELRFSLLDMTEGGAAGTEVVVTQNGLYLLQGFAGSAVSVLEIVVNNYSGLWEMIRDGYGGRLVDILDVSTT